MKKTIFLLAFAALAFLWGCNEDKGNYNYTPIDDIGISGIENKYSVLSFEETLRIAPTVETDIPEGELEYLWLCYNTSNAKVADIDTLARSRNLDFAMALAPGNYVLTYGVRDKRNDYTVYKNVALESITRFSRGFYVLKENAGGDTDMDLHIDMENKAEDLLERSLGAPLDGKPTRLGLNMGYSFIDKETNGLTDGQVLLPMSEKDVRTMRISDMSQIYDFEEMMFGGVGEDERPYFAVRGGWSAFLVTSKGVYSSATYYEMGQYSSGKFGLPTQPEGVSRFVVGTPSLYGGLFYFDETNGRFISVDMNGYGHTFSNSSGPGLPQPNGIKHTCLALDLFYTGAVGTLPMAVFQDADDPARKLVYVMKVSMMNYANPIDKVIPLGPDVNSSKGVRFAFGAKNTRMLYSMTADNKLYCYDIEGVRETPVTLAGIAGDEEVTYMAHKFWSGKQDTPNHFDYFVVATHKAGAYKVYMYEMNGGQPLGNPRVTLEGAGKVRDMQYVSPSAVMTDDLQAFNP